MYGAGGNQQGKDGEFADRFEGGNSLDQGKMAEVKAASSSLDGEEGQASDMDPPGGFPASNQEGGTRVKCSKNGECECQFPWSGEQCEEDVCGAHTSCNECRDAQTAAAATSATADNPIADMYGCKWNGSLCVVKSRQGGDDELAQCSGGAEYQATPLPLWLSAGLPLVLVFACGGLLVFLAKCVRKCFGGGPSGPAYTPVDTAQGAESGGENWGWDGDNDDIEMPPAEAAAAVGRRRGRRPGLGRDQREGGGEGGGAAGRRGGGGAGAGQADSGAVGILPDDDLFAELGIEAKPTFRGKKPPKAAPPGRSLALDASDVSAGGGSWVDDDLDDLLK
eukprot:jgi/Undpi1/13366/HiC_scaffold_8.g03025.m1